MTLEFLVADSGVPARVATVTRTVRIVPRCPTGINYCPADNTCSLVRCRSQPFPQPGLSCMHVRHHVALCGFGLVLWRSHEPRRKRGAKDCQLASVP